MRQALIGDRGAPGTYFAGSALFTFASGRRPSNWRFNGTEPAARAHQQRLLVSSSKPLCFTQQLFSGDGGGSGGGRVVHHSSITRTSFEHFPEHFWSYLHTPAKPCQHVSTLSTLRPISARLRLILAEFGRPTCGNSCREVAECLWSSFGAFVQWPVRRRDALEWLELEYLVAVFSASPRSNFEHISQFRVVLWNSSPTPADQRGGVPLPVDDGGASRSRARGRVCRGAGVACVWEGDRAGI